MSFNWLDFLALAEKLQSDPDVCGPKEACYRSAISRAYYSAFQYSMIWARKNGYPITYSGEDHKGLQRFIREVKPPDKTRDKISLELNRLLHRRKNADYEHNLEGQKNQAIIAIDMAKSIIRGVDSLK